MTQGRTGARAPAGRPVASSDHLLRTFAAVPVGQGVLVLEGGRYGHAGSLAQLGFDVHVCSADEGEVTALREAEAALAGRIIPVARLDALGYPDAFFDWVVLFDAPGVTVETGNMTGVLREARRVLKPGGWIYAAVAFVRDAGPARLLAQMAEAGLVPAATPQEVEEQERRLVRVIFRRVEPDTPL